MGAVITLKGIDQAIANLNYQNRNALKSRLILFIRGYYSDEESVAHLSRIDTHELIHALWETGDHFKEIKRKRKNFNSVKSSLNTDLQKLFEAGKNPEGVSIGSENIFVMSNEAKDKFLKDYGFFMLWR